MLTARPLFAVAERITMKKFSVVLAVLIVAMGLTFLPASPASATDYACLGYEYAASVTSSGHTLSTKINICGSETTIGGPQPYSWGVVAHAKCYRDGVLFGDGTGGCRWAGHLTMYLADASPDQKIIDTSWAYPGSLNGSYVSDSGRQYSQTTPLPGNRLLKFCSENAIVHFVGITGVDYGIWNMLDKCVYYSSTP
jgi:hypothetical protein